ncbi:MAG: hypothetical protein RL172_1072 [Bacteroidota bacterium]
MMHYTRKALLWLAGLYWLGAAAQVASPAKVPQAIYFNAGGNSPLFSIQYDRRFTKQYAGAGFAAGAGYYGGFKSATWSVPITVYYLLGRQKHFAELSGGTVWVSERKDFWDDYQKGGGFVWHLGAGYRFQAGKGLIGRTGVAALRAGKYQYWSAYAGLGFAF